MKSYIINSILIIALYMQGFVIGSVSAETDEEQFVEVVFETNKGNFTLRLSPEKAPKTVGNFLKYVDEGFYDNTIFHRAIPGFVVQGGGFEKGMKYKQPHAPVKNESANLLKNTRGTISMARRSHPDTATSQFYINLANNKNLDYKSKIQPGYTVFGHITDGMDVIDKIAKIPTKTVQRFTDVPSEDVVVNKVTRKRVVVSAKPGKTLSTNSAAHPMERYIEGEHYTVLANPVPTRNRNKIEVVEMFSYGCPHCYEFEADIKTWGKNQDQDVDFWFFPAVWNKSMELYAKAFYAAFDLGVAAKVHMPLFHTIVIEQKSMRNENDIQKFFANYGVSEKQFKMTFNSTKVIAQAKEAESRVKKYKPAGVPEIVVNGKYRVERMRAGGMKEMLAVTEFLVNKERQVLNKKK